MNYFKRLYNWVLHWSNTKYGVPALFLLSLSESSFFPIPPDVLLIALCLGMHSKALYFAFVCSLASVLGAMIGFAIGYFTCGIAPENILQLHSSFLIIYQVFLKNYFQQFNKSLICIISLLYLQLDLLPYLLRLLRFLQARSILIFQCLL